MADLSSDMVEQSDEQEVDLLHIFGIFRRYWLGITVITLLSTVAAGAFAYFQQNIYHAGMSIELPVKEGRSLASSLIDIDISPDIHSMDNEMEIFQSSILAEKTLSYMDLGVRYFTTSHYKTIELVGSTPIVVRTGFLNPALYGVEFKVIAKGGDRYTLQADPNETGLLGKVIASLFGAEEHSGLQPFSIDATFGKAVTTPWFSITVEQIAELQHPEYRFVLLSPPAQIAFIRSAISASPSGKLSSVLNVQIEDNNAQRAVDLTDAVSKSYLELQQDQKYRLTNEATAYIDKELKVLAERLKASSNALEQYKSENALVNLSGEAQMTAQKLSDYQSRLKSLSVEEEVLRALKRNLDNNKKLESLALGALQISDTALLANMQKLQDALLEQKSLMTQYTEVHPEVVTITKTIEALRQNLGFIVNNDLSSIRSRKKSIQRFIEEYNRKLSAIPMQEQQLAVLTTRYSLNEKYYNYLLEKRSEIAISSATTLQEARLINRPQLLNNGLPVKPKRKLLLVLGLVLGLILGSVYAFVRDWMREKIERVHDVEAYSKIPLFGTIPLLSKRNKNIFDEAFRILRTFLFQYRGFQGKQVIMVTSTKPGEGKSSISLVLGKTLADSEKRAVIIDADLRMGTLNSTLKLKTAKRDLTSYLRGLAGPEEIIVNYRKNCDVILVTEKPDNPAQLISSDKMHDLIEYLRERYNYIIIDTPPLGIVSDSLTLLPLGDLTLVVARANYTNKRDIKNIDRLLSRYDVHNTGFILNAVTKKDEQAYGYGYGSYDKASHKYYV